MRTLNPAIAIIFILGLTSISAWAKDRDFTLYNHTEYTISGFFYKTAREAKWAPMQGEQIGPNESKDVHFTRTRPCELQFRIETTHGARNFTRPFDFCRLHWIGIHYANGVFLAEQGLTEKP